MITEFDYLNGHSLWDAIFNLGNSELIEIYKEPFEIKQAKPEGGIGELVSNALNGILALQNKADRRQRTLEMLQRDTRSALT